MGGSYWVKERVEWNWYALLPTFATAYIRYCLHSLLLLPPHTTAIAAHQFCLSLRALQGCVRW